MRESATPVGRRVAWVLDRLLSSVKINVQEIKEHFAPSFLASIPPEQVLRVFSALAARGLKDVNFQEDTSSPYALQCTARVGDEHLLIRAQTEAEEPYRLVMLHFRPDSIIRKAFDVTPGSDAPLAELIEEHVGPMIQSFAPHGLLATIVRGEEVLTRAFGSVSEDQLFEIGSVTKPFTATLLAEMADRGEVSLEDAASKFLPDGVIIPRDPAGDEFRLIDLATHTSSLPRLPPYWEPADPRDPYADFTFERLYKSLSEVVLDAPIGSSVQYSNFGFAILGHLLSLSANASYEELVVERVCRPLEMYETGIAVTARLSHRAARGYGPSGEQAPRWKSAVFAPAGGIETTIGDLSKFLLAQISPGSSKLSSAIVATQLPLKRSGEHDHVGLAWQISHLSDSTKCLWHTGQTGGFSSALMFHGPSRTGAAILVNSTKKRPDELTARILASLANYSS